ncbi:hypothetical protein ScPMuIL_007650 [Solemya velum]
MAPLGSRGKRCVVPSESEAHRRYRQADGQTVQTGGTDRWTDRRYRQAVQTGGRTDGTDRRDGQADGQTLQTGDTDRRYRQAVRTGGTDRRYRQAVRTGDTDRRYRQAVQTGGTDRRYRQAVQTGDTDRRYRQAIRTGGIDRRYRQAVRTGGTDRRYRQAVRTGGIDRRYGQAVQTGGIDRRYGQAVQTGGIDRRYRQAIRTGGTDRRYRQAVQTGGTDRRQAIRTGDTDRRYGQAVRTGDTDRRYRQAVQTGGIDRRYRQAIRTGGTDRRYRQAVRTGGTDRRYRQAVRTGDTDRRYGQAIQTGDTDRRYRQAVQTGDTDRRYGQAIQTGGTDRRYGQAIQTGDTDRRYRQAIRTGGTDRRYRQAVQTGGTDRRYSQVVRTGGTDRRYRQAIRTGDTDRWYRQVVQTGGIDRRYGQAIQTGGIDRRYGQAVRTGDTDRRYRQAVQTGGIDRRYGQAIRTGGTDRRYRQAVRTGGTDRRYRQAVQTGGTDRRYRQAVRTGGTDRRYRQAIRTGDTDRRYGQAVRTGDTDRRYGQAVRTGDTDRRYGQAIQTGDTDRRYRQAVRTDVTDRRYRQVVQTGDTDRRYRQAVQTGDTDRRYRQAVQTGDTDRRYGQAVQTGGTDRRTDRRYRQAIQTGGRTDGTDRRYRQAGRTGGTDRRYRQADGQTVQTGGTDRRYGQAVQTGGTDRRYRQAVQTGGTDRRYGQAIQTGDTDRRYRQAVQTGGTDRRYRQAVQTGGTDRRYGQAVQTGRVAPVVRTGVGRCSVFSMLCSHKALSSSNATDLLILLKVKLLNMLTDQHAPTNNPGDLDNLIKNFEYENQQYVKLIEKENQQIEALEKDIDEKKLSILSMQDAISKLDSDTKRAHRQYTQNRDNCLSLKTTMGLLKEHGDVLTKKLAFVIQNGEQEAAERSGMLQHYVDILKDYKVRYKAFPLYQKLEVEQSRALQLESDANEAEIKVTKLQQYISQMNGDHGSCIFDITQFIIKLAETKVNTKTVIEQIKKAVAEKNQLEIQIEEAKAKKEKELEIQRQQEIAEREKEIALSNMSSESMDNPSNAQKEQADEDGTSANSVMISMFSDKEEQEVGNVMQTEWSHSSAAEIPTNVVNPNQNRLGYQPLHLSNTVSLSNSFSRQTLTDINCTQGNSHMETAPTSHPHSVQQQQALQSPAPAHIQQVVPQSPKIQKNRFPQLQAPAMIQDSYQHPVSVAQSRPQGHFPPPQDVQSRGRPQIHAPGMAPPNSPVSNQGQGQGRCIPQFIVPTVGNVTSRPRGDPTQTQRQQQTASNFIIRNPGQQPRHERVGGQSELKMPEVLARTPERSSPHTSQPVFSHCVTRVQRGQGLESLYTAGQMEVPSMTPVMTPTSSVMEPRMSSISSNPRVTGPQPSSIETASPNCHLVNQVQNIPSTPQSSRHEVASTFISSRYSSTPITELTTVPSTTQIEMQTCRTPGRNPQEATTPKTPENQKVSPVSKGASSPFSLEKHQERIKSLSVSPGPPTYTQRPMFEREIQMAGDGRNPETGAFMNTFFDQFGGTRENQSHTVSGFGDAHSTSNANRVERTENTVFDGLGDGQTNQQQANFFGGFGGSTMTNKESQESNYFSTGFGMTSPDLSTAGSKSAFNFSDPDDKTTKGNSFMSLFSSGGDTKQNQSSSGFSFSFGNNEDEARSPGVFSLF